MFWEIFEIGEMWNFILLLPLLYGTIRQIYETRRCAMNVKRILTLILCLALLLAIGSVAYARGHGNGAQRQTYCGAAQQQRLELCRLENCDITRAHRHDGIRYRSQICLQYEFELCPVINCSIRGIHEHDGVFYRCADYGQGFGCGSFSDGHTAENRRGNEHGNRLRNGSCRNR